MRHFEDYLHFTILNRYWWLLILLITTWVMFVIPMGMLWVGCVYLVMGVGGVKLPVAITTVSVFIVLVAIGMYFGGLSFLLTLKAIDRVIEGDSHTDQQD